MKEHIIDARGIPCPQPVIKAKEALKQQDQDCFSILVDNEIAVQNLTKFGAFSNVETSWEQTGEKEYQVRFIRTGESHESGNSVSQEFEDQIQKGSVVVVSADHMGEGDEVLGKILIKGFIYALTQLEQFPETILFYNGGAKLTVNGSESVEDLKNMEEQGTQILTCGTCLNHYGIEKELSVGGVTNMYVIAEILAAAKRVIRP